jgi:hypothetical protein
MKLLINLYGGPGSGKSTGAAYIFSQLKLDGIDCEYVSEFIKDKIWEDNKAVYANQFYITAKQSFKISRTKDKVDVVVTDSPIFMGGYYAMNDPIYGGDYVNVLKRVQAQYPSSNYFIKRVKKYNPNGRFQNEEQAIQVCNDIEDYLNGNEIHFCTVNGDIEGYKQIIKEVKQYLHEESTYK